MFGLISLFNHLIIGWQLYLCSQVQQVEKTTAFHLPFLEWSTIQNGQRALFHFVRKLMVRSNLGLLAMITF